MADREFAFDFQPDNEEKDCQQSVVDPLTKRKMKCRASRGPANRHFPKFFERRTGGRVGQQESQNGHGQQQQPGRGRPTREIQRCGLDAMAERSEHRFGKRALVPRPLVAAVVDEECRRDPGAAAPRAVDVTLHFCPGVAPSLFVAAIARRQAEFRRQRVEIPRLQRRAALHQRLVRRPVFSGSLVRVLRQLGGAPRILIAGERAVAEHITHPVAEAISQIGDDFVGGKARRAVEATVFHERDGSIRIAQRVIGPAVHWRIESI